MRLVGVQPSRVYVGHNAVHSWLAHGQATGSRVA